MPSTLSHFVFFDVMALRVFLVRRTRRRIGSPSCDERNLSNSESLEVEKKMIKSSLLHMPIRAPANDMMAR